MILKIHLADVSVSISGDCCCCNIDTESSSLFFGAFLHSCCFLKLIVKIVKDVLHLLLGSGMQ